MELAYLGLEVSDIGATESIFRDVVGLVSGSPTEGTMSTWRNDKKVHRILLSEGERDDVSVLGLEVADRSAYDAVLSRLAVLGASVASGNREFAVRRRVDELSLVQAPWGLDIEVVLNLQEAREPFHSELVHGGFLTDGLGLGHAVFGVQDLEAAHRFLVDGLGFSQTDWLEMDIAGHTLVSRFYRCNGRHHSIALAGLPFDPPKKLHHLMMEVTRRDEVGFAFDRAISAELPIASGLGKHENDEMFSFYLQTPPGFQIEIGYGARIVGDWTENRRYTSVSAWGHQPIKVAHATTA